MFSFTLDIYCTSVRPGRGIPHMWLSLRVLLSFYLLKGFFSSLSWLLLRVKGRGCHTLLKPYETNCGLWIWAILIKFDWLIDWIVSVRRHLHFESSEIQLGHVEGDKVSISINVNITKTIYRVMNMSRSGLNDPFTVFWNRSLKQSHLLAAGGETRLLEIHTMSAM